MVGMHDVDDVVLNILLFARVMLVDYHNPKLLDCERLVANGVRIVVMVIQCILRPLKGLTAAYMNSVVLPKAL